MDPHPQEYKAEVSTLAVASWVGASAEPLPGCIAANSSDARARVSGLMRSASHCGAARARTREWSPPLRVVAGGGCSFWRRVPVARCRRGSVGHDRLPGARIRRGRSSREGIQAFTPDPRGARGDASPGRVNTQRPGRVAGLDAVTRRALAGLPGPLRKHAGPWQGCRARCGSTQGPGRIAGLVAEYFF